MSGNVTSRIVASTASTRLAGKVASQLGVPCTTGATERFPDGELRPSLPDMQGDDVFVIGSTGPPVSDNLVELMLLIDASRRAGAARITAVVPYFGYARQDRRERVGDAVGARVMAHAVAGAGADHMVVVDAHTAALEAMFGIPVEMLSAVPTLAEALQGALSGGEVVVAPDLGALKLAEHYGTLLDLPVAVVRKTRISGTTVRAEELIGQVKGRRPVIVDDMISTGATIEAAIRVLEAQGAVPDIVVVATHGLLVGPARRRLKDPALRFLLVTDSTATAEHEGLPVSVRSIARLLAEAVSRLHDRRALDELTGTARTSI